MRDIIGSIEKQFLHYKDLGEGAIRQVSEPELNAARPGFDNSIVVLVWHITGNLKSRFTDFLTSDGEKPWRVRDEEFVTRSVSRAEIMARWEEGWSVLLGSLAALTDDDLKRTVSIRNQSMAVHDALHRGLAHLSYHVGQIVYIAKASRGEAWTFMSHPPAKST